MSRKDKAETRSRRSSSLPRAGQFFASTALANGIPIHEVSRWLGHKSIKTTVDTYGHLVPGAWHRGREILQEAMRPLPVEAPTEASQEADGYEEAV
ncbi:hypothetical protein [Streptomyces ipomoeae]|uniref:hypothetical protein n=1 Tax=Streptomyces ipomoeae TaxID=103232 RepID=UPI001FD3ED32|nr:hypothetical protein [Streptomyces ipomoeae]MDX2934756.1 hypothetical protein [Streptomyces ipomoeae]